MALSTTFWAVLIAAALLGAAASVALALQRRGRLLGAVLVVLFLASSSLVLVGYRRAARAREGQSRYYAGLDEKQHGNLEDAERAMRQVLALEPGHPEARRELEALSRPPRSAPQRRARVQLETPKGAAPGPPSVPPFHKPSDVGITDYALDATFDPARHGLSARAAFALVARRPAKRIEMSLSPEFRVTAVKVNGAPALHAHVTDLLTIEQPLRQGQAVSLVVSYARKARKPLLACGDLIDSRGIYLRPESRWYPATGELDFYSPLRCSVRVPRGFTAVCAGRLVRKDVGPREVTFHWQSTEPVRMVCLAAGKYAVGSLTAPGPPVETYLYPRHRRKARGYQTEAARILAHYSQRFGAYPYPKLAIAEIPVFPGGYGSTSLLLLTERSFAEKGVPVPFLAHEIAHQWWGNRVCPQGPGAGWLSEAFAEYSAVMYEEHTGGPKALQAALKRLSQRYLSSMRGGPEQAIADTDPYAQFGCYEGVIYFKGAYVLHHLRRLMGDAPFARLLRTFAERFSGKRAAIADFEALAAEIHGRPLAWFFDQWLRRPGAPRLKDALASQGGVVALTVMQESPAYRGAMDIVVADAAGKTRHALVLDGPRTQVRIPTRGDVTSVAFDPDAAWLQYTPRWVKGP